MHSSALWLLFGLAAIGLAGWRIVHARRRAAEMRASRDAAMAIALAEAHKAAAEAKARRQAAANDAPAITRTVARPTARPAAAPIPSGAAAGAAPTPEQVAKRAQAERIALEAARRARAQKQASLDAERRAPAPTPAPAPAPAPAPTPAAPAAPAAAAVTRVIARAPAAPAAPAPAPRPSPVAVKTPGETLIMLADDSKIVRVKTSRLLEGHQYRVITATDGLDAVRQLETVRPDLIITDVDMPGMDGFGLTRHLRSQSRTADIPIVMITSAEDRHREDAQQAGVGLVLGKPYPEEALIEHIRSFRFTATQAA